MNYNPEMLGTLVIQILRQDMPLVWILTLEDTLLIQTLRWEDTPLIWATPSAGSLLRTMEGGFGLGLLAPALSAHPSLHLWNICTLYEHVLL